MTAPDAGSPWVEPRGRCVRGAPIDLLFVVDGTGSMVEEQASLAAAFPELLRALMEPPDDDGDGRPDWHSPDSLRVGVITVDMGSGGYVVPTCGSGTYGYRFGDDGILRTRGATSTPGCRAEYPSFLDFRRGDDRTEFAANVACLTTVGTAGCGFEQPLEAMLKALSPSTPQRYTRPDYVPPTFFEGTLPHGDGANAGFLREDSLLGILLVTDEDDCSVHDPEIFDPSSSRYGGVNANLRCAVFHEAKHPIERYVEGLLALRAVRPDLLAVALLAGIPLEFALPDVPDASDYEDLLAHPNMQERIDPEYPHTLVPSCNVPDRGVAFPPRRLVRVAAGLGRGRSIARSICEADLRASARAIARLIGRRACAERASE